MRAKRIKKTRKTPSPDVAVVNLAILLTGFPSPILLPTTIGILCLALSLLGDTLRDVLDPRTRLRS